MMTSKVGQKMTKQRSTKAFGAVAIAGIAAVALTLSLPLSSAAEPAEKAVSTASSRATVTIGTELGNEIPSLYRPNSLGMGGLDLKSSRLLGSVDGADYWIANDLSGNVCLVGAFGGEDWYSASSCGDPTKIDKGLGLQIGVGNRASEVYYTAGISIEAEGTTARLVVPGLYSVDPSLSSEERKLLGSQIGIFLVDSPIGTDWSDK